jgi:hypothetical protein
MKVIASSVEKSGVYEDQAVTVGVQALALGSDLFDALRPSDRV